MAMHLRLTRTFLFLYNLGIVPCTSMDARKAIRVAMLLRPVLPASGGGSCGAAFGWSERAILHGGGANDMSMSDPSIGAGAAPAPGWMNMLLCAEGGTQTLKRCARSSRCVGTDGPGAASTLSAANPFRIPVFLKTHKVGGSMFGRALKRAQKLHVNLTCTGLSPPRAGCDEFYRSIPDFGHDSEYAYQCCGFKALQSTRDGCVPSGRAVYLTMVREPFEHMLSSFFYRRTYERPDLYPLYNISHVYFHNGKYPESWPQDLLDDFQLTKTEMLHPGKSLLQTFYIGSLLRNATPSRLAQFYTDPDANRMTWPAYRGTPCDGDYSAVIAAAVAELAHFDVVGLLEDFRRSVALSLIKLDIAPTKDLDVSWFLSDDTQVKRTHNAGKRAKLMQQVKHQQRRPTVSDIPADIRARIEVNPRHRAEVAFYAAARAQYRDQIRNLDDRDRAELNRVFRMLDGETTGPTVSPTTSPTARSTCHRLSCSDPAGCKRSLRCADPGEYHEVRCCSDARIEGWHRPDTACPYIEPETFTKLKCEVTEHPKHGLGYDHAFEVCDVVGARMCTADELESERCGRIPPCPRAPGHIKVWTFTPLPAQGVIDSQRIVN